MMDEIKNLDKEWLTPKEVALVLGGDPHTLRVAAHTAPEKLGFPVIVIGSRVKIPRMAFIRFMEGGQN